jgi:hypothetical protein
MKTFNQRRSSLSECEKKFGKILFGSVFGGEEDTKDEMRVREMIKKYLGDESRYGQKEDFVRAFRELKACTGHFPKELTADRNTLYRGTSRHYSVIKEMKDLKHVQSTMYGPCLVGELPYKSKFPIQSWSPSYFVGKNFAEMAVNRNYRETTTLLPNETVAMIFACSFDRNELLFNSDFLQRLKVRFYPSLDDETEIMRISNAPVQAKAYIPMYQAKIFSTAMWKDPEIRKILLGIGGKPNAVGEIIF